MDRKTLLNTKPYTGYYLLWWESSVCSKKKTNPKLYILLYTTDKGLMWTLGSHILVMVATREAINFGTVSVEDIVYIILSPKLLLTPVQSDPTNIIITNKRCYSLQVRIICKD